MSYTLAIGMIGAQELLIVLGILLLIFGGTRLPQLAKGLGASIREFKRGAAELDEAGGLREAAERRLD
ncbi:MAG TPA: twin-arginine translocase TatA/TatE family subunit [Pyrinomonadaceae bacterium]|jgi:sec-independent protein translocase protein TatA